MERGKIVLDASSSEDDECKPTTTSRRARKNRKKGAPRTRAQNVASGSVGSSEEDEALKRALELSRRECIYISDNDEELNRAIALSLEQTGPAGSAAVAPSFPTANNDSAVVVSDDEYDEMCANNISLKEKLSKSSLGSGGEEGDNSVRIVTPRKLNGEKANLPELSSDLLKKKESPPGEIPGVAAAACGSRTAAAAAPSRDPVSSSFSSAVAGPSNQRGRRANRQSIFVDSEEEAESEFAASCSSLLDTPTFPSNSQQPPPPPDEQLSSVEVRERMRSVFTRGLENHLTLEEMEPCRAIATKMHPHQKTALAWMVKQEQKEMHGMRGGILADDMGLGKTLTVIALILTNFHDGRPLSKPDIGYVRPPLETLRANKKRGRKKAGGIVAVSSPDLSKIGSKIKKNTQKTSAYSFFDKFKEFDKSEKKSTAASGKVFNGRGEKSKLAVVDYHADSELSEDEYDRMCKEDSLSKRLNASSLGSLPTATDPQEQEADKLLEELDGLTPEERSKRLRPVLLSSSDEELPNPALNLDGAFDSSDSAEDEDDLPLLANWGRKKIARIRSDEEVTTAATTTSSVNGVVRGKLAGPPPAKMAKLAAALDSDSDVHLSDIDLDSGYPAPCSSSSTSLSKLEGGASGGVKRLVPLRDPAPLKGRRRPTLLVCPTSLISHWCQEIDKHVDPSVRLRVKIHYGNSKALTGADLNSYDVVITTYGTLASEFSNDDMGPLQRAKFFRVVLDEGHFIKNHRTKSAKAANSLDTERRWVITGTPIQNNLLELWSLAHWLRFGVYADQMAAFKNHIERPCKSMDPRGFERLQVLMDAICLRRTKDDRRPNGDPIVKLPSKTIKIRDVELNEEERLWYRVLNDQATDIVLKYMRRGELLRNYAHIFALMTRLRQMCCHLELIQTIDWSLAQRDKEALERELGQMVAQDELGGNASSDQDAQQHLIVQLRNMLRSGITDDCSICLDDLKSPVITPCAHVFCRLCIERCLEAVKPSSCPLCRREMNKQQLLEAGNYDDDDVMDKTEDATLAAMKDILVNHSSSKVDAVLREILRIRRDRPDDKIIVVSQFTSFLSMIQPLLDEQDLSYVRLDGTMSHMDRTDVVNLFQKRTPNSPKLLLLSLKAGGVGLNLTAANHLLLLDPAWNPAAEWQCFDRVHRLGQDKDVFIYKFITKESIEIKMMELQEKKKELINGAFIMPDEDRRRQRIQDILNIFSLT